MSRNFSDEFENEKEGGPADETFEEMLRRLAASGNLHIRHVDGDGDEDDNDDEGESVDLGSFMASVFGGASLSGNDDEDEDFDEYEEDDDDSNGQEFSIGFGFGSDGSVTPLEDEGSGGLSFSFTLDQDGEEVPEIRCPKCNKKDTDVLDWDTDTYKCNSCGHEFVPEIYKVLDTAEDYLNRAWRNFKERNYKRTIKDATKAIALDSNLTLAYTIRGKALGAREEYQEAEKDFSEAIRISPDDDNAHFSRGETRLYLEKYDEAIEDLSASIGFDPDFADTYVHRANAYFKKENYPQAIEDFSEAIEREPDNASAIFQRGYTYSMLGQDDKALADYNKAIELNPDDEDSFVRRAELHERNGRFQEAIKDYKNFLRSAGGEPDPVIIERIKALQLKLDPNAKPVAFDPDEEVSIWEDVTLSEDSKVYRSEERGEKLLEQGDFAGAHKEFSDFIAHQPKNVAAYIHLACVDFAAGNLQGVIEDFTGAINCGAAIYPQKGPFSDSVDPRFDQIHLLRALSYALAGQEEKILPDLIADAKIGFDKSYTSKNWPRCSSNLTANDRAVGKFIRMVLNENENNRTPVQDALLSGLTKDAEGFAKTAVLLEKSDPHNPILLWAFGLNQEGNEDHPFIGDVPLSYPDDNAEIQFVRGLKSMTAGEFQRGKELMVEAIRLDPDNAEYYEKLGVFLARANEQDDAIGYLTKAIELNPNAKDSHFYRGIVHKFRDEFSEAQADFLQVIELESAPGNTFSEDARQQIDELKALEAKKEHFQNLKAKQNEPLETAAKYIERGQTYLKTGEWEKAYLDFDEAIRLEPTNAEAFRFRGASLYKMGEAELAIKDYSQAIKLDPNNSDLHLNRGILQADSGDSDDALVDLNEAIRLNPKNAIAYHVRARVHAEAWFDGDSIDQATEDFEKAIELDPDNPDIYKSLADFWGQPCFRGAEDDALADLDQAIRLAPENAEYYLARFKVKAKLNDATGASEDLTKAFLLDPSNEEVKELVNKFTAGEDKKSQVTQLMMSAMEKINSGDLDGCIEDLKQAYKLDPDNQGVKDMLCQIPPALMTEEDDSHKALILVKNAHEKFNAEDYEGCITDLTEAITLNPNEELAFRLRGLAYLEKGLEDEAYRDWSEAIRLGNINPEIYFRYVNYCLGKDDYDATIDVLTRAIDRQLELDEDQKMYLFVNRGYAYLEKGMHNESISDSSRAISLKPDDPIAYENRAEAYKELKNLKSAISDYQVFVELTEDDEEDKNEALGFIEEMTRALISDPTSTFTPMLSPEPKKVELANTHILRASELKESRDFAGALKEVQLAKYIIPDDKLPYEMAFAIYNDVEDWDNAIANLQEVIRIKPDDVMAHKNLGALKTKVDDLDGAVADLIKATKLDPKHAQSHLFLGVAYLMQSKYDQAKESLTRSIELDPTVPVAYLHRASTKEKLKDYPAAIPDFEKYCALGGSPEVPDLTPLREHITFLKKDFGHMSDADIQLEEHKQKLQNEIDGRTLKLKEMKLEIGEEVERLRKERESLGFLAMGKKKEIDQKILSLQNSYLDYATKIESLRTQLKNLKP